MTVDDRFWKLVGRRKSYGMLILDKYNKPVLLAHIHAELRRQAEEIEKEVEKIPDGNGYRCDKYHTDNEIVLTVWDEGTEKTYDIRLPKI